MENASKALIMAASVLLGLLLITVFVRVFKAGASVNENYDQTQRTAQLKAYNAKFENYNVMDNTIFDLITVANNAYSVNEMSDYDPTSVVKIEIYVPGNAVYKIPDTAAEAVNLEKNKILDNTNKVVSIYSMLEKTLPNGDHLDKTYYGPVKYTKKYFDYFGNYTSEANVTEMTTVYRYYFKCDKIEYHDASGKVKYMKFSWNTDMEEPYKWKTEYN